ncbi:MAG TPA: DUF2058 domain-containing protein [Gammaproteobacteria bacterium]
MGNSLFDQLKKSGLAGKSTAHKVRAEKHKQAKQQRQQKGNAADDEAARLAEQARQEKLERDRRLNAERKAQADRKALAAQIKQLVETHRQSRGVDDLPGHGDDGIAYNFVDAGKVKTIRVSKIVQQRLSRGQLAIVALNESYELVPNIVADRILARDPQWFVSRNDKEEVEDEDDPYKDYKIPDDLIW